MERVEAHDRIGCAFGNDVSGPRCAVGGHELQVGAAFAEGIEDQVHDVFGRRTASPLVCH